MEIILSLILAVGILIIKMVFNCTRFKKSTLALNFKNRYVFISDLHIGNLLIDLKKLAGAINEIRPDYVLFGGDLIDEDDTEFTKLEYFLQLISSEKIFILGNHDLRLPEDQLNKLILLLSKYGTLLRNSSITVDNHEVIYGYEKGSPLHSGLADINLVHNPNDILKISDKKALFLSGHFHGGQIKIPFLLKLVFGNHFGQLFKEGYFEGLYTIHDKKCYISSGIGFTWLPMRLFTLPEILIID